MVLSQMAVASVDISFFAHATEDQNKVVEAAKRLLPATLAESVVFDRSNLRGHHGNPITLFETKIKEKGIVKAIVDNLSMKLSDLDKEKLMRQISLHVEKGKLYLRFDKQAAFLGEFKLSARDPIRVRIRFKKSKIGDVVQICHEIGIIP